MSHSLVFSNLNNSGLSLICLISNNLFLICSSSGILRKNPAVCSFSFNSSSSTSRGSLGGGSSTIGTSGSLTLSSSPDDSSSLVSALPCLLIIIAPSLRTVTLGLVLLLALLLALTSGSAVAPFPTWWLSYCYCCEQSHIICKQTVPPLNFRSTVCPRK